MIFRLNRFIILHMQKYIGNRVNKMNYIEMALTMLKCWRIFWNEKVTFFEGIKSYL